MRRRFQGAAGARPGVLAGVLGVLVLLGTVACGDDAEGTGSGGAAGSTTSTVAGSSTASTGAVASSSSGGGRGGGSQGQGGAGPGGAGQGGAPGEGGSGEGGADGGAGPGTGGAGGGGPAFGEVVQDFSLTDVNPNSPTYEDPVSPRDYLEMVSGWYFGHAG